MKRPAHVGAEARRDPHLAIELRVPQRGRLGSVRRRDEVRLGVGGPAEAADGAVDARRDAVAGGARADGEAHWYAHLPGLPGGALHGVRGAAGVYETTTGERPGERGGG